MNKEEILKALSHVDDPDLKKDLVTLGMIKNLVIKENTVTFDLELTTPACPMKEMLTNACKNAIKIMVNPQAEININVTSRVVSNNVQNQLGKIKNIILVGSGKGGVGKSTVSAGLALALGKLGAKVGLLDADIYGPSLPTLFHLQESPEMEQDGTKQTFIPFERHGIKLMSIGFVTAPGQAIMWRGPMVSSALKQLLNDTKWEELDYLIVDMPPGTGDVQISLAQQGAVTGAVMVSTPQEMALADARRAINMLQHPSIAVPILGVIENMSYFIPEDAPDKKYYVFGENGGKKLSEEFNAAFLGELPLKINLRKMCDEGINQVPPEFLHLAGELARQISILQSQKVA